MEELKNEQQPVWKRILPHAIAVVCFLLISVVYFSPVFQGKVLPQGDVQQFEGSAQEIVDYYNNEGESTAWTNSMFSGMPAYQIGIWGGSPNFLDYLDAPLKALGAGTAGPLFASMLMAYILFCLMGFKPITAVLGAVAYGLSSYNIIIIDAGHVTKAWAIAYIPLILAGVAGLFRNKYLWGSLLLALGIALQVKSNHLQVTFYTGLLCIMLYVGYIVIEIINKKYKALPKVIGFSLIAVALAVACNIGGLYSNYEMTRESTRGQSELTTPTESEKKSSGLDKDYAFAWSYGKGETLSLLIPNIHGGATGGKVNPSSNLYKATAAHGLQLPAAFSYWGDQPFTSGPVYFGAIVCFLFVLGMFIIKNKLKWVLFIATIFFIFLSWGYNFDGFNSWFFYNFPFYNKFRTVSMALVIPAITMLVVAVWAVNDFFSGNADKSKLKIALFISGGITAFICLLFALMPGLFFDFASKNDVQMQTQIHQMFGAEGWTWFSQALHQDRKDLLSADALRSLVFVVLATIVLWGSLNIKSKQAEMIFPAILAVLILADLWAIDRRYLNDDHFQNKASYIAQQFPRSVADEAILQDKQPSYRVLNLNNPFNESATSYYHKSIGGYHAAKLKRYQELIDYHLTNEINTIINSFRTNNVDSILGSFGKTPSLNMLNAKYIIYSPEQPPLQNPYALGNAWFVSGFNFVDNADAEIAALNTLNPATIAVVDKRFEKDLAGFKFSADSAATITLTTYKPNKLVYKSKANSEQLAIFSEVYYANGWQAYIDGKEAPHFRADWTLRAMRVPAGEHEIVFAFEPHDYLLCRTITTASSAILVLALLGSVGLGIFRKRKE
ncbi:diacylglycerol kinase [Dysgonomonas sp. PH5-45]|uniref:YfhO family protein n=1 Tax=unclassified Dysgonomonas TaxID=2630389 RepID=UPI002474658E|nr:MULTISPECIES: YfhO family protein [unclassified Dysgonomonas]MDH6355326.1 diacylglycerol kinase [Dysgonomonas sp. PH5-45]MDH6388224.1 diacylglycerol kinase [Dysgonomonas sp. PH5-37]